MFKGIFKNIPNLWQWCVMLGVPSLPFWGIFIGWYDGLSAYEKILWVLATFCFAMVAAVILIKSIDYIIGRFFSKSYDHDILFEVSQTSLPKTAPEAGKLNILSLYFDPKNPDFHDVGVSYRRGEPHKEWDWGGFDNAIKCVVKNFSNDTALNVKAKVKVQFREWKQESSGRATSGDTLGEHEYQVFMPVLKSNGENEFEFYIYNQSPYMVVLAPDVNVEIGKIAESRNKRALISYASGGPINVSLCLAPEERGET